MDWTERMNAAVDYIEDNLAGDIDMAAAARRACCSEYHFTRFFSFIADLPLNEYIRRRRLTMAGFLLQKSAAKIIDVATQFGYDSPNSFARAFQALHGITPSEARATGAVLKSYPRITFQPASGQQKELHWRIVTEGERTVFGKPVITTVSEAYEAIPKFWDACEAEGITNQIVLAGHGNQTTLLSSVMFDLNADGEMKYLICMDLPPGGVSAEYEVVTIPERTWAVFPLVIEHPGVDSIVSIWKRVYPEWFPTSGYEQDTGPRQERYYWRPDGKGLAQAWVPVVKAREQ